MPLTQLFINKQLCLQQLILMCNTLKHNRMSKLKFTLLYFRKQVVFFSIMARLGLDNQGTVV